VREGVRCFTRVQHVRDELFVRTTLVGVLLGYNM
jgi:hypothetical protein